MRDDGSGGRIPLGIHAALAFERGVSEGRLKELWGPRIRSAGAGHLESLVRGAPALGIGTLTLVVPGGLACVDPGRDEAEDGRPQNRGPEDGGPRGERPDPAGSEALRSVLEAFLRERAGALAQAGVGARLVGRRERLPASLLEVAGAAEAASPASPSLLLRLALDPSGRREITAAIREAVRTGSASCSQEAFGRLVGAVSGGAGPAPDLDLLVLTDGRRSPGDALLWEAAYAEFVLCELPWWRFGPDELEAAVREFRLRDRRFGRVAEQVEEGSAISRPGEPPLEAAS